MSKTHIGGIFLALFLIMPISMRTVSHNVPNCEQIDCRLINISQTEEMHYYPGFVSITIQVDETKSNGENFWHGDYDLADSGLYKVELIRNLIVSLVATVVVSYFLVRRSQKYDTKKNRIALSKRK